MNNSLGHHAGDMLLQQVSRRFLDCVRRQDHRWPHGRRQFVILLRKIHNRSQAAEVSLRIVEALQRPFDIRGHDLPSRRVSASRCSRATEDAETLIKHADAAMYLAKEQGRNNQFFGRTSPPMCPSACGSKRSCAPRSTNRIRTAPTPARHRVGQS